MASSPIRRCAIYTRKSSEEGLGQDFNSLHAQREACEAFIKSQAGEGWRLVKTAYDDGGFSGGTMERPALQQLLEDIRSRLIDAVVVYKVDRLTRSLADFAKMVELFDSQTVSFVAVTQPVQHYHLDGPSHAQCAALVRAIRARSYWRTHSRQGRRLQTQRHLEGGALPLRYEVHERKLVINHEQAQTVRQILERYLELGSVRLLKADLARRGVMSEVKVSKNGNRRGGKPFSRGALYWLLSNPIYVGEIRHKQERYPGQHEAIVSRTLWERVQQRLRDQAAREGEGRKTEAPRSPLAGKLFDENGEPLYVQGAAKGQRRYRYYVSRKLVRGAPEDAEHGWRVSAPEIERAVYAAAKGMLSDRVTIAQAT